MSGQTHRLEIHEGAATADSTAPQIKLDMREYEIVSEAGLFKRGKLWKKGERIDLERKSALNFLAVGDIKEI